MTMWWRRRPVAVGWAVLLLPAVGCAPPAGFRPVSAVAWRHNEVGAGLAQVTPRPFVDEAAKSVLQFWGTRGVSRRLTLSLVGATDGGTAAGGAALVFVPVHTGDFVGGMEAEAGILWGSLGVPLAGRIGGDVWLYGSPRLGNWGDQLTPTLPLGISVPLASGFDLRAEGAASWAGFRANNRRLIFGAALAYSFGNISK